MSENASTGREHDWLHLLPAAIGISVGGVYALGALNVSGQLYAADLPATQVLGLVPVDQMLARGIASLITPAAYLAFLFVLLFGVMPLAEHALEQREEHAGTDNATVRSSSTPPRLLRILDRSRWWLGVLVLGLVWALPPLLILALVLTLLGGFAAMSPFREHFASGNFPKFMMSWMGIVLLIGAGVGSFLQANPLPDVSLKLRDCTHTHGGLVLQAGDTWYVKNADDRIEAVPSRNVRIAHVDILRLPRQQALFELALNMNPIEVGGRLVPTRDDATGQQRIGCQPRSPRAAP